MFFFGTNQTSKALYLINEDRSEINQWKSIMKKNTYLTVPWIVGQFTRRPSPGGDIKGRPCHTEEICVFVGASHMTNITH